MLMISLQSEPGLALRDVFAEIPHDAASIFVFLFVGASLFLVWRGSRRGKKS